jgi:hypothetical protein
MTRPGILASLLLAIVSLIIIGDAAIFCFIQEESSFVSALGAIALVLALLISMVLFLFPFEERYSSVGGALGIVSSITIVAVALPSFGNDYVDVAILSLIILGMVFIHRERYYDLEKGMASRRFALVVLILLPILSAIVGSYLLRADIENRFAVSPPIFFIPFAALFGYLEEVVFRGGVQREMAPLTGPNRALVCGAVLDAGLMVFWGSYALIAFTFVLAMLLGYIYKKCSSVTLVGVTRAIEASWLMIILAMLA